VKGAKQSMRELIRGMKHAKASLFSCTRRNQSVNGGRKWQNQFRVDEFSCQKGKTKA